MLTLSRRSSLKLLIAASFVLTHSFSWAQDAPLAPNWMMDSIQGERISLYEETNNGHHVVLVFWATWCQYCRALLPELATFEEQLNPPSGEDGALTSGKPPLKIIAMNIWEENDPLNYISDKPWAFTWILKGEGVAKNYGVRGTPAVFLIDSDNRIRYSRKVGEDAQAVIKAIRTTLSQ